MKSHVQNSTRRFGAIGIVGIVIGLVLALASPLSAASYSWTNYSAGHLTDYWTNSASWNPSTATPGGTVVNDVAYLTNSTSGIAYTNILNVTPGFSMSGVVVSNTQGSAWLDITNNATLISGPLTLGNGGQLAIEGGSSLYLGTSAGALSFSGTNGTLYINKGATLTFGVGTAKINAMNLLNGVSGVTGSVSSLNGPGGVMLFQSGTLAIFGPTAATNNFLTLSGITVSNFADSSNSGVVIGTGAGTTGNTLLLTNGARLITGYTSLGNNSSSNTVIVAGGALWNVVDPLYFGSGFNGGGPFSAIGGTGNVLQVSGGTLTAGSVTVGNGGNGVFNLLQITGTGVATINALTVATNNSIRLDGGVLNITGTSVISNFLSGVNTNFTVGDGVQSARLNLAGGTVNSAFGIAIANNGTLSGNGTIPATTPVTNMAGGLIQGTNGNLLLQGVVSGASTIRADQSGTLTFSAANTFTTNLLIRGGTVVFTADNNLGAAANQISMDTGALQPGATMTEARTITLGAGGGSLNILAGQTTTWTGMVSGVGALMKASAGTLVLSNANTFSGGLIANQGTVQGYAQPGQATGPFGTNTGSLVVGYGNVAATLATLILNGQAGTPTVTTNGDLVAGGTFNGGTLTVNAAAGGGYTTLQLSNLVRNGHATLIVAPGTGGLAVSNKITFIGNGSTLVNNLLPVWMVANNNGGDFLTYGLNGVTNTTYVNSFGPGTIVNNTALSVLPSAQQAYALKLSYNVNLDGHTLTIGDGTTAGMIFGGGTAITNGGAAANLNLGSAEAIINLATGNTGTIGVNVAGTGGLTLFGGGALVLTNLTTFYSGDTTVEGGTLTLAPTMDIVYSNNLNGGGGVVFSGGHNFTFSGSTGTINYVTVNNNGTLTLQNSIVTNQGGLTVGGSVGLMVTNGQWVNRGGSVVFATVKMPGGGLFDNNNMNLVLGYTNTVGQQVLLIDGAGVAAGSVLTNGGTLYLGSNTATSATSAIVTNGGGLYTTTTTIGLGTAASPTTNNSMIVAGTNTVWVNTGNLTMGNNGTSNSLTIAKTATVNVGGILSYGAGSNNTITATDTGTVFNVGYINAMSGVNGALILSNGASMGFLQSQGLYINGSNNAVTVTGPGSAMSIPLSINVGQVAGSSNNPFTVANGGVVRSGGALNVGAAGNTYNQVLVTGSGSVMSNAGGFGLSGTYNSTVVSNGGLLFIIGQYGPGSVSGASNQLLVTGNNSVWTNATTTGTQPYGFQLGGVSNSLTIANGGKVFGNTGFEINANSTNTAFLVTGPGSYLQVTTLNFGRAGFNLAGSLTVTDGATVVSTTTALGAAAGSNSNTVNVAGNGALWNLSASSLIIGGANVTGNVVTVGSGGTITNTTAVLVGVIATSANNGLVITNGGKFYSGNVALTGSNEFYVIDGGSGLAANTIAYNGLITLGAGGSNGFNRLVATNATVSSAGLTVGSGTTNNTASVYSNVLWDLRATAINVGSGAATGNVLSVTGGILSNIAGGAVTIGSGSGAATFGNSLLLNDGAKLLGGVVTVGTGGSSNNLYQVGGGAAAVTVSNGTITVGAAASGYNSMTTAGANLMSGALTVGNTASNNTVSVGAVTSWNLLANTITIGSGVATGNVLSINGGVLTNATTVTVGSAAGANGNRLLINNRGALFASTSVQAGSSANNNSVLVSGGVLDANTLAIGAATTGNTISNSGGVFQFSQASPTITSLVAGDIAVNNGTISFRGINTADVTNNLGNGALKSIVFAGANTFMLNAASNLTAGQAYTFQVTASPSNYANLALINGQTAYQGGGVTIGATGSLLVSNTVASFAQVVTNQGVAVLVNSSATLSGGLLNGPTASLFASNTTATVAGLTTNSGVVALVNSTAAFSSGLFNQGTITNNNTALTIGGLLTMNNGTLVTLGTAPVNLGNNVNLQGNGTFDVSGGGLTLAGAVTNSGALTKLGSGNLALASANTFAGDTRPIAGAVVLGNSYAVSNSTVNLAGGDTGSLVFSNNGAYTLGGLKGGSGRTLALTGSDNNPVALTVGNNGQNTTFGGSISGGGSITKVGAGTLVLSGPNSYSGDTYINQGQLVLADPSAAANSSITVPYNNALAFSNATSFAIAGLTGSGNIGLVNVGGAGIGLTVSNTDNSLTYSGVMSGSGSLTKAGNGTLELTANHTFSGTVDVSAGKLLVNGSLAGGAPLTLSANTVLGGSGTVGRVVSGAGQVAPGNSPGLLTVNQLDPSAGMGFEFEFTQISPNYADLGAIGNDVLRITNATPFTVALGLSNTVNLVVTAPLTAGVINYLRGGFYSDSGAMFDPTINGATYNLFIDDGGPLAFVHTVAETTPWGTGRILEIGVWGKMIPEPQVVMFWLTGAATLYAARRRMQRRK